MNETSLGDSSQNPNNPFLSLSELFIDNQRQLNIKANDLSKRLNDLAQKLNGLRLQVDNDIFTSNLVALINIEEESKLILSVGKELEFQREQILKSVELLKESKKIKLNK